MTSDAGPLQTPPKRKTKAPLLSDEQGYRTRQEKKIDPAQEWELPQEKTDWSPWNQRLPFAKLWNYRWIPKWKTRKHIQNALKNKYAICRSAYSIGVGELGWQYGTRLKSHGTVRLMHRKRVTCELHDCYFRSMTIKHAIPKTAGVTHSDGQLWGDIEWAIELLYNSVKTGSQWVWKVWRQDVVEKASTQQRPGPPGLWLSNPGERERNTDECGGQYVAVLFGLQLSLTHNLSNKVGGTCFSKEVSSLVYYCVIVMILRPYVFVWLVMAMQHKVTYTNQ